MKQPPLSFAEQESAMCMLMNGESVAQVALATALSHSQALKLKQEIDAGTFGTVPRSSTPEDK